jgi:hypothetical protein
MRRRLVPRLRPAISDAAASKRRAISVRAASASARLQQPAFAVAFDFGKLIAMNRDARGFAVRYARHTESGHNTAKIAAAVMAARSVQNSIVSPGARSKAENRARSKTARDQQAAMSQPDQP